MTSGRETYTLINFLDEYNNELNQTKLNAVYQAYFMSECVTINGHYSYCTSDNDYKPLSNRLIDLYKKFLRNMKLISNVKDKPLNHLETNQDKVCLYLKYWFYDNLIRESVTEDEFKNFFALWNMQKSEKCKECYCQFEINSITEIKVLKNIYDYFLFTDAYKKISIMNNEISKKNYCEYINNAKASYSLNKDRCAQRSDPYCSEFKKYLETYLKVEEDSSIICNNEKKPDTDAQTDKVLDQKSPLGPLAETVKSDKDVGAEEETHVEEDGSSHSTPNLHHQHPSPPLTVDPNFLDVAVTLDLSQKTYEGNTDGITDSSLPDSSDDGRSTGTIVSASSVGTIGFLFLLYKFTPLRSMLDPRIRKTKKDLRNAVQGINELQSQDYDFYSPNMHFNRYNIGYQST